MFQPLGSLLGRSLRRSGVAKEVQAALVLDEAQRVITSLFSEEILEYVRLRYIQGGALVVSSSSSAAASELRLRESEILSALNKKIPPSGKLERIRFVA